MARFLTAHGGYKWRYVALDLRSALATFSRLVSAMFHELHNFSDSCLEGVMKKVICLT